MIRVLVAETSRIHSRLLADALKSDPLLEVTAFECDSSGLVAKVMEAQIDVLVLCATFDGFPLRAFEILHELRTLRRATRSVLLLGSSDDEIILKAFRAGARGLFSNDDPLEQLRQCVHAVHEGKIWAGQRALAVAVEALASSPAARTSNGGTLKLLSKRELQVVRSLAEGLTNREIAEHLKLSPHTIKNYLFRIFDKLGVSSRVELLFMSLSQAEVANSMRDEMQEQSRENVYSNSETAMLEKSAEAGIPAAQLALAQLYFFRQQDPQDLVNAYMWYLVATERALLARGLMTKFLTPEQIEEAKHKAAIALSRMKRIPPSSTNTASAKSEPAA